MAKGKKTGGRDFQKGQVGNPNGNRGVFGDMALLKHKTRAELMIAMCNILKESTGTVRDIALSEDRSSADTLIAAVVMKGIQKGCYQRLNLILTYIVGRPQTMDEMDAEGAELLAEETGLPDIKGIIKGASSDKLLEVFQLLQKAKDAQPVT